jgi:O-acetyl-ADP-ribose deacetylase (regulator of RNase III)
MSADGSPLKDTFQFGPTTVAIRQGRIETPGVDVDVVVSTDDNYMTMGGGVAATLAALAGPEYVRAAQVQCPTEVGSVLVTEAFGLPEHGLAVRKVLHGAVIDLDDYRRSTESIVHEVTTACLARAEDLGLTRVLLPAFAMTSGRLAPEACARQVCGAIKGCLARDRRLDTITVMLHLPDLTTVDAAEAATFRRRADRNTAFLREANAILDVPYDPSTGVLQVRDHFGHADARQQLESLVLEPRPGARHAAVPGGRRMGKSHVLYDLCERSRLPDRPLGADRRLAYVTFGHVHERTPSSFVYRKLMHALADAETEETRRAALHRACTDATLDCAGFVACLQQHADQWSEVVFVIDDLHRLLVLAAQDFWRDLDCLAQHARFVFAAPGDDRYLRLRDALGAPFKADLVEIPLRCLTDQERREWIQDTLGRHLGPVFDDPAATGTGALEALHDFVADEAGRHPYLVSLACYALLDALKRAELSHQGPPSVYDADAVDPVKEAVRRLASGPRLAFFDNLMDPPLTPTERQHLERLAQAISRERQRRTLLDEFGAGNPNARDLMRALDGDGNPRQDLHEATLRALEAKGFVVDAGSPDTVAFAAPSLERYVCGFLGIGTAARSSGLPTEVVIGLEAPEPQVIRTRFHGSGARIVVASKHVADRLMTDVATALETYLQGDRGAVDDPQADDAWDLDRVGSLILTQFSSGQIKAYLQAPPMHSSVRFEVDEALQHIPWELMLEAAYAGEIPFRVGRTIVSRTAPSNVRPVVRGDRRVNVLLIGDPTGDLPMARAEVEGLARKLRTRPEFEVPDVFLGPEQCTSLKILRALSSGDHGLVHYAGHSRFDGFCSAWIVAGDVSLTTEQLTNALQMGPPALVFSASCESATAGRAGPVRFEDQTFDLPGAFLQAGVQAYIGSLWPLDEEPARRFTRAFYRELLGGAEVLGECIRRAKMALKSTGDHANWPAIVLYGDPRTGAGDLFPALRSGTDAGA